MVVNELIWVYRGLGKQVSGPATASSSPSQRAGLFLARRFLRAGRPRTYRMTPASSKFPTSYRNKLIPLAEISLNCLLPWQPNPAISAYHGLTGAPFDFRAHPVSPAGTSILIHEAWYIGRAWCSWLLSSRTRTYPLPHSSSLCHCHVRLTRHWHCRMVSRDR